MIGLQYSGHSSQTPLSRLAGSIVDFKVQIDVFFVKSIIFGKVVVYVFIETWIWLGPNFKIKWNENISLSKEFADSLCRNHGKTGFDLLKNILEGITLLRFEKGTWTSNQMNTFAYLNFLAPGVQKNLFFQSSSFLVLLFC